MYITTRNKQQHRRHSSTAVHFSRYDDSNVIQSVSSSSIRKEDEDETVENAENFPVVSCEFVSRRRRSRRRAQSTEAVTTKIQNFNTILLEKLAVLESSSVFCNESTYAGKNNNNNNNNNNNKTNPKNDNRTKTNFKLVDGSSPPDQQLNLKKNNRLPFQTIAVNSLHNRTLSSAKGTNSTGPKHVQQDAVTRNSPHKNIISKNLPQIHVTTTRKDMVRSRMIQNINEAPIPRTHIRTSRGSTRSKLGENCCVSSTASSASSGSPLLPSNAQRSIMNDSQQIQRTSTHGNGDTKFVILEDVDTISHTEPYLKSSQEVQHVQLRKSRNSGTSRSSQLRTKFKNIPQTTTRTTSFTSDNALIDATMVKNEQILNSNQPILVDEGIYDSDFISPLTCFTTPFDFQDHANLNESAEHNIDVTLTHINTRGKKGRHGYSEDQEQSSTKLSSILTENLTCPDSTRKKSTSTPSASSGPVNLVVQGLSHSAVNDPFVDMNSHLNIARESNLVYEDTYHDLHDDNELPSSECDFQSCDGRKAVQLNNSIFQRTIHIKNVSDEHEIEQDGNHAEANDTTNDYNNYLMIPSETLEKVAQDELTKNEKTILPLYSCKEDKKDLSFEGLSFIAHLENKSKFIGDFLGDIDIQDLHKSNNEISSNAVHECNTFSAPLVTTNEECDMQSIACEKFSTNDIITDTVADVFGISSDVTNYSSDIEDYEFPSNNPNDVTTCDDELKYNNDETRECVLIHSLFNTHGKSMLTLDEERIDNENKSNYGTDIGTTPMILIQDRRLQSTYTPEEECPNLYSALEIFESPCDFNWRAEFELNEEDATPRFASDESTTQCEKKFIKSKSDNDQYEDDREVNAILQSRYDLQSSYPTSKMFGGSTFDSNLCDVDKNPNPELESRIELQLLIPASADVHEENMSSNSLKSQPEYNEDVKELQSEWNEDSYRHGLLGNNLSIKTKKGRVSLDDHISFSDMFCNLDEHHDNNVQNDSSVDLDRDASSSLDYTSSCQALHHSLEVEVNTNNDSPSGGYDPKAVIVVEYKPPVKLLGKTVLSSIPEDRVPTGIYSKSIDHAEYEKLLLEKKQLECLKYSERSDFEARSKHLEGVFDELRSLRLENKKLRTQLEHTEVSHSALEEQMMSIVAQAMKKVEKLTEQNQILEKQIQELQVTNCKQQS